MPRSSAKKRKRSPSLLEEETNKLVDHLTTYQSKLDLLSSRIHQKLRHDTTVPSPPFEDIGVHTSGQVGIRLYTGFALLPNDRDEIEVEGKAGAASGGLSFDATVQLINVAQNNIHLMAEAGYRMLIDVILLRIASTVHGQAQKVDIIPNIPVDAIFETDSGNRSFIGVIDYLLARVPDRASSSKHALYPLQLSYIHLEPSLSGLPNAQTLDALTDMPATLAIIRADSNDAYQSCIEAPLMAASYCNRQKLSVLRGCITTGEKWWFFVYVDKGPKTSGDSPIKAEGEYYFSNVFKLEEDLRDLPLILGLFGVWANETINCVQKYFANAREKVVGRVVDSDAM